MPGIAPRTDHAGMSPLHVYIHFPWCLEKCPYCDFVSFKASRTEIDHEGYADAVIRELVARSSAFPNSIVRSVFFGGGTPSLWEPEASARVLVALRAAFPFEDLGPGEQVEVTFECNPSSLDAVRAKGLAKAGANRLSVGIQSLDDARLKFLGRLHNHTEGLAALDHAARAVPRVSGDLIFALPGQEPSEAANHAVQLVQHGASHVSAYALTIEDGTRFGELARRGRLPLATDDATADTFLAIEAALGALGLAHYEVSNYARRGHEARHNLGYWRGADYLGLGTAAYGFGRHLPGTPDAGTRYRNDPDPRAYMNKTQAIKSGTPSMDDGVTVIVEPLDREILLRERLMLGLRLLEGIDIDNVAAELDVLILTDARKKSLDNLIARGLVQLDGSWLRVVPNQRLQTDGIAARLF